MTAKQVDAFVEAKRVRSGVATIGAPTGQERAHAMIELTRDFDGDIADCIIATYNHEPNRMEAITVAFLAGLLLGRDGG